MDIKLINIDETIEKTTPQRKSGGMTEEEVNNDDVLR